MKPAKWTRISTLVLVALAVSLAMATQKPNDDQATVTSRTIVQSKTSTRVAAAGTLQAVASRTVSGHRIAHYQDGPVPLDLSIRPVAAYVLSGGVYTQIPGTGNADGTFTIPNVPKGPYLLRLGGQYLWTSNTKVNADYYYRSRSSAAAPVNDTTLTFNLTNLNLWQDTDFFELIDPNSAAFGLFPGVTGETTFTGTFPYTSALNDSTQGDKTYFLQLITQPLGGYPFVAAGRYFKPSNFFQTDGGDTAVSGKLKSVTQNQTFRANISGAYLAAQALAVNPRAVLTETTVALDAYPGSLAKGWLTSCPDLVAYSLGTAETPMLTVDQDFGDVLYGNPFPQGWPLFAIYQYNAATTYLAPGATNPVAIPSSVDGNTTILPAEGSPLQPLVGPVTNPTVGGFNFFAFESGIGLTPTLTWTPPYVGTANLYAVYVYQLDSDGVDTFYGQIGRLQTQEMSIVIPDGMLQPGVPYVFMIRAYNRPGVNVPIMPYVLGPIGANADVLSGVMFP